MSRIVKSQPGFRSSQEPTKDVITPERWVFLLFPCLRDMCTECSLWQWTPPIYHWIELSVQHKRSSLNILPDLNSTLYMLTLLSVPPVCNSTSSKKRGFVMLTITDLLFLELCFHHFDLCGRGFLIGFELLYFTDPCQQGFQILEKCLGICWCIPQCQDRFCSLKKVHRFNILKHERLFGMHL